MYGLPGRILMIGRSHPVSSTRGVKIALKLYLDIHGPINGVPLPGKRLRE